MIQLTEEEYCQLLWAAIHDDRRIANPVKEIGRHWDQLPSPWRNLFNDRNKIAERDAAGAVMRKGR